MIHRSRSRARALTGAALAAALAVGGVAGATSGAAAVPGECDQAFPVTDLAAGQAVTGSTVSTGTTPEGFTGEVLGVVDDGIFMGLDMIMVRLDSSEINRVGGIWAGMSGSPVYAADGRLIGAVSYGLALGPSPVAGVTPFEDMNDYLPGQASQRVKISAAQARAIARESDVTVAQAQAGFARLPVPLGVSGIGADRLNQAIERAYMLKNANARPMGTAAAPGVGAGPETLVAGGNLGVTASYGDVTFGGVGTVTSVCGTDIVGFGHPMFFLGRTTAMVNPATAVYIQEDPTLFPFKVANLSAAAGTIDQDRLAAVSGSIGALPEVAEVSSSVAYGTRSRTGSSNASVPRFMADVTWVQIIGNQDRVIDAIKEGSALQTWTVTGRRANGSPFSVDVTERYADSFDISFATPWDVANAVWTLGGFTGVKVDDVSVSSAVNDDATAWRLRGLEQRRGGNWFPVGPGQPVVAQAGATVRIRVTMTNQGTTARPVVQMAIPRRAAGARGRLAFVGGDSTWNEPDTGSLDAFISSLEGALRNDEVRGDLSLETSEGASIERSVVMAPRSKVVRGSLRAPVRIS